MIINANNILEWFFRSPTQTSKILGLYREKNPNAVQMHLQDKLKIICCGGVSNFYLIISNI